MTHRAIELRQIGGFNLGLVGLKYLAKAVHQAGIALRPPVRNRLMFLQDHFQAVGELALNNGFANPGDGLKNSAGLAQIDCEKIARQMGGHIGAQRDGIVVHHVTLNGNGTEAKQRQAL